MNVNDDTCEEVLRCLKQQEQRDHLNTAHVQECRYAEKQAHLQADLRTQHTGTPTISNTNQNPVSIFGGICTLHLWCIFEIIQCYDMESL